MRALSDILAPDSEDFLLTRALEPSRVPAHVAVIDEQAVAAKLYTAGMPDPDLLIRTSGEMRISNFLLWQIAYSELYITEVLWPYFNRTELLRAMLEYQRRDRRFGGLSSEQVLESTHKRRSAAQSK